MRFNDERERMRAAFGTHLWKRLRWAACVAALALTACAGVPLGNTSVTAERLEPGGRGLFIVRPFVFDSACETRLAAPNGTTPVDCNTEFIVGCDATTAEGRPFCTLITEKGPVRESIYPKGKR